MPLYMWQQEAAAIVATDGSGPAVLRVRMISPILWCARKTPRRAFSPRPATSATTKKFAMTRARARMLYCSTTSTVTISPDEPGDSLTEGTTIARCDGKYDVTHSAPAPAQFSQTGHYEVTGFRVEMPEGGQR